jgi:hypothetical protein
VRATLPRGKRLRPSAFGYAHDRQMARRQASRRHRRTEEGDGMYGSEPSRYEGDGLDAHEPIEPTSDAAADVQPGGPPSNETDARASFDDPEDPATDIRDEDELGAA